ncbi:MAG: hypothetical protein ACYCX2_07370 [Christensenellales bacterium]
MRKRKVFIPMIAAVLALVLFSCTAPAAPVQYYSRFTPDTDKIVSLSVQSEYASVQETYHSVYDYMAAGEKLVKFDNLDKQKRVEDLEYSISLFKSYLENNDKSIELADMNIDYNKQKYEELKNKYGSNPTKSEKLELDLLLKQNEMIENSKQGIVLDKKSNQQIYDANAKTLQELKDLPDYYLIPVNGYLLTLAAPKATESGDFDIGTMIAAADVILEVEMQGKEALSVGKKVKIKLSNQWLDMYIYKITDKLLLKFTDISLAENLAAVNFMQPYYIELLFEG